MYYVWSRPPRRRAAGRSGLGGGLGGRLVPRAAREELDRRLQGVLELRVDVREARERRVERHRGPPALRLRLEDRVRDPLRETLEQRRERREPLREDQIRVHVVDRDVRQHDLAASGQAANQL